MQDNLKKIEAAGATLVAISADAPTDRDALVSKLGLEYPVISDSTLKLTEAFGVRQKDKDVPLPSIFVVDASGTVTWREAGTNIVNRPNMDDILKRLP